MPQPQRGGAPPSQSRGPLAIRARRPFGMIPTRLCQRRQQPGRATSRLPPDTSRALPRQRLQPTSSIESHGKPPSPVFLRPRQPLPPALVAAVCHLLLLALASSLFHSPVNVKAPPACGEDLPGIRSITPTSPSTTLSFPALTPRRPRLLEGTQYLPKRSRTRRRMKGANDPWV